MSYKCSLNTSIDHVSNIPTMQLFTRIFKKTQSNYISYITSLTVSGISKIMHCEILINMPHPPKIDSLLANWLTCSSLGMIIIIHSKRTHNKLYNDAAVNECNKLNSTSHIQIYVVASLTHSWLKLKKEPLKMYRITLEKVCNKYRYF